MARFTGLLFGLATVCASAQSTVSPRPATPVEPVAAIIDALRSHDIVALDEGAHDNEQSHALRLALIRHPALIGTVNDIVVEFGSARYQDVIDRFVRGEPVDADALRHVWQDTTQPAVWDVPMYEAFFRAVRAVNAPLAKHRQLRVLLGDPPIDWTKIRTAQDHFAWLRQRDVHAADLIQREVLAKRRRALLLFGGMHLQRRHISANYETIDGAETVISVLDRAGQARIFTIATPATIDLRTLEPAVAAWPAPRLAILRGTQLGAIDFARYVPSETTRFALRDGAPTPLPREQWRVKRMEDQFDAVLYLGPLSAITFEKLPSALCEDAAYVRMRRERLIVLNQRAEAERFERTCRPSAP